MKMFKPITDPDLGKLEFIDVDGILSYSCKMTLPISTKQVEIFFETNSVQDTPTTAQKKFLQSLIEQYDDVLGIILSNISDEVRTPVKEHQDPKEQFDLDTVGIPLNVEGDVKWDLSLLNRQVKTLSLLANFEGINPIKVWVEQTPKRSFLFKLFLKIAGR